MSNINQQTVDQAIDTITKAISSVDVAGLALVREDLQAELAIEAPTSTPVRNRLNRIQGNGKAHSWYKLIPTSADEGLFLGTAPTGGFFEKGGLPNSQTPKYKHVSAPYTSLGDLAQVTFFDQMAGATYTDQKKHQIKIKMLNTARMEEWAILNGDSSVNPLQFDGLVVQVATNTTDKVGVALALNDLTTAQQTVVTKGGHPDTVVMSYREIKKVSDLILASAYRLMQTTSGNMADIAGGIAVTRWVSIFGSLDLVGSEFLPSTGSESTVLVLDTKTTLEDGNAIQMVDLMPLSSIDLALLGTAYRTLVAEFTVLQVTCEAFQHKIYNVGE